MQLVLNGTVGTLRIEVSSLSKSLQGPLHKTNEMRVKDCMKCLWLVNVVNVVYVVNVIVAFPNDKMNRPTLPTLVSSLG
jgi:Zn-finger protein